MAVAGDEARHGYLASVRMLRTGGQAVAGVGNSSDYYINCLKCTGLPVTTTGTISAIR